jgi:fucose permease
MVVAPVLLMAFFGFVVLGLPSGAQGVAWPSIADTFERAVGDQGILIITGITGYFSSSLASGALIRRFGTGRTLTAAAAAITVALATYAATGSWVVLLGAGLTSGAGGGVIDTGINAYVALHHGARAMGVLHGSYGIGSTLGPLLITVLLDQQVSWRWGYGVLAVLQLAATVALWRTRHGWRALADRRSVAAGVSGIRSMLPALAGFFLVAGIEVGVGSWAFSLLTVARERPETIAGYVVTGYWASFTVARLALGGIGDRIAPIRLLRAGIVTATAGLALVWWAPGPWASPVGLLVAGVGLAPVFPLMVLLTPLRVGSDRAAHVIGYQLGAATLGVAIIPGGLGPLIGRWGLEVVPPILTVGAAAMAIVLAGLPRLQTARRPSSRRLS